MSGSHQNTSASVLRRCGAMLYECFLIVAVLIVAATPPVMLNGGPILGGNWLNELKRLLFLIYLVSLIYGFFGWFWIQRGQTLGMLAWKIKIVDRQNRKLTIFQVLIRLTTSVFGLANLWCWFDKDGLGWHERLSATQTLSVSPGKNTAEPVYPG